MDTHNIFNTDILLLFTLLICNIVSLLNIIDNSILGICCRLGLGVLNGLFKFQGRFSPGFLALYLATFYYF